MEPKIGEVYLNVNTAVKGFYFEVIKVESGVNTGNMVWMRGIDTDEQGHIALLFFDKHFMKVNESAAKLLFGRGDKDGQ